ncbi:MAG: HD domain-containing protein [Desulfovibrionaceae bacterium]
MPDLLQRLGARERKIRDPLYGYIWLSKKEMAIVDSPLFQRLRRVHQLALTKYVYPSAEHTRFVHSLGVMHCATQMFRGILANSADRLDVSDHDQQTWLSKLRLAALLHDIGHLPFSHAAEEVLLQGINHEDISRYIIQHDPCISSFIQEICDINPSHVANILSKNAMAKHLLLHDIVSGQLDADRSDYLLRDSYACGVKYGEYDFVRYMNAFGCTMDNAAGTLFIKERDIPVIESFLLARYHYNMQVPYHRTRVGYDITLRKYFETLDVASIMQPILTINNNEITEFNPEAFEEFDDYDVFQDIKRSRRTCRWAAMLLRKEHLVAVLDTNDCESANSDFFKKYVAALADAGFKEDADFFPYEQNIVVSKFHLRDAAEDVEDTEPSDSDKKDLFVIDRDNVVKDVCQSSPIIKQLGKALLLLRVYVLPEKADAAKDILKKVQSEATITN